MYPFKICNTVRLNAESLSDNVSITNVMERLDIEELLKRAQQGILDLRTFDRPRVADVVGAGDSPESSQELHDLLDAPHSPMDSVFGVDKESAYKALNDLHSIAGSYKVKETENPPQGETAPLMQVETTQEG